MSRLLRSNVVVALGTTLSRATGLLRLTALLAVIGRNPLSDAYLVANETPNIVYELIVGGVLSATLVPLFTSFAEDGDDESRDVVVTFAIAIFVALTAVAVVAAPLVFGLFTRRVGGDVDAELFRAAGTALARIFLVQILFYGLVGLANAYLNSRRRFFAAAWSPVLPNLIIIATLLSLPEPGPDGWSYTDVLDDTRLRLTLGLGATLGIASMAVILVPAARAAGLRPRLRWDPRHPAVRRLLSLSLWTFGFVAANIVALTIVRNLTEPGSGEATAYLAASTFFMLPHGLLGVSLATTFQPDMARAVARGDRRGFVRSASLGIRMTALLTIPAGVGIFVLRRPLVGAALQYRELGAGDAELISDALAGFALGLGAFSVYLFVLRAFYAHQDTRTAFTVNAFENLLNIAGAFVLVGAFGVVGLSASFALAYVVSALWVLQILSYKVPGFSVRDVLASVGRFVVASALMGEAVWLATRAVGADAGGGAVARIVVGVVVGVGAYAAVLVAMGAPELDVIRDRLPRRSNLQPE
ncbi:murein biosynthesis integral membrane protein MurJ [Ilumatobacter sp.]|uniref:murein biosynthesis integral membrane protein MurJ n=1 Tax=Ilumatobacter sp. TaxID=1967498 RepID=UPI003B51937D